MGRKDLDPHGRFRGEWVNGFSFVKGNGLSLVYVFTKKKVTYLGGQVGDQAWRFGRHWVKAGRIGDPTGRNVEPCTYTYSQTFVCLFSYKTEAVK